MEFKKDGTLVELSKTEQKLLRLFMENQEVTLSRSFLLDQIWTDHTTHLMTLPTDKPNCNYKKKKRKEQKNPITFIVIPPHH